MRIKFPRSFLQMYITAKKIWESQVSPLFNLRHDLDEIGTIETIEKSIVFQGAGVWTLIFAVLIASIGLNVNSTAVIIGAMLISPLMGPIVGAGLALGINDSTLLRRALRNLFIATAVSIAAATLYFFISPLAEAQSELLARTQPTIYDVLIAIFGGAAGVVAGTRKDKPMNAISGAAIATALMPPLCTAGFGLAHGYAEYFMGAIYLYIINSLFICMSTLVIVRMLGFKRRTFVDIATERRAAFYMGCVALVVAVPSVYTAYQTVSDAIFRSKANRFLTESFHYPGTRILEKKIQRRKEGNLIELSLIGKPLDQTEKAKLKERLEAYGLKGSILALNDTNSVSTEEIEGRLRESIKSEFLNGFYQSDLNQLKNKDERILQLENELFKYKENEKLVVEAGKETQALTSKVKGLAYAEMPDWRGSDSFSLSNIVIVRWKSRASNGERQLVERFLKARLKSDSCEFIHQ